jgi:AcrR family transcriptional regulator
MARTYTLNKRALQQADTRRRIVEAAIDLHGTVGPAQTTLSMIAERAGVQRHTLYAHFADERSMHLACSALSLERDPLPDAGPWRGIPELLPRLRAGLGEIYAWYERNAALAACVLRDAEYHALTREIVEFRFGPSIESYHQALGAELGVRPRALLAVAISFFTWRSLTRDGGLTSADAADAMAQAVASAT